MYDFVLNWNQRKILKNISFLKKYGMYLAGGTALALHLGHRTSQDLDFYTKKHFNSGIVYKDFQENFKREKISDPDFAQDTLKFRLNITDLSFFRYNYPLIRSLSDWESTELASVEDIVAMKIEAIIERGTKRDFVDIYYLMKKCGLKQLLNFTQKKYSEVFNEQICLIALMYFKDAEITQKDRKRLYLYENIEWRKIKEYIEKEVKQYQLEAIKKR